MSPRNKHSVKFGESRTAKVSDSIQQFTEGGTWVLAERMKVLEILLDSVE